MRLSAPTSFFGKRFDGDYTSFKESIRRIKAAGFDVVDIHFSHALFGKTDLVKDDWQERMDDLRNEAEKIGIEFSQSHPVFLPGHIKQHSEEKQEVYQEMMRRSMIASSILGVKWAVLHPLEKRDKIAFDLEANIKENLEYHRPAIELAMKHNVGIALENMLERSSHKRRFCSDAGELAVLIDAFQDERVGACWDFGHGNTLYQDQTIALRKLGKRLKATHVNDNYGVEDEHMFPFHGSVDWHAIMPVFAEIGYVGDFSYETHKEFDKLPEQVKDDIAKVGYSIGQYCLSLSHENTAVSGV